LPRLPKYISCQSITQRYRSTLERTFLRSPPLAFVLKKLAVEPILIEPPIGSSLDLFNRWAILTMTLAILPPLFYSAWFLNRWAILGLLSSSKPSAGGRFR
jgi:hypothetical protein